ncbi:MAG: hypothetical protein GY856_35860 [bacterium]|nr:hypothetical protein [bacterium]
MSRLPRTLLLTSDQRRHLFAAGRLAAATDLVGIVSEAKSSAVSAEPADPDDREVVRRHFRERDEAERLLLGEPDAFPDVPVLRLASGEVNQPAPYQWVKERAPEVLVLYGTSIIKPPLLTDYTGRLVNIHLGLSPYYRGSATNFWPLVHRRPECVGATVHLAVAKVDAGPILAQVRPPARAEDRAHELGTKTLMGALEVLPQLVAGYLAGTIEPTAQDLSSGRALRNRDFNAAAVRSMWEHFATGMMAEYLADADERRRRFPIVEVPR